jgi:hypothetical protein
MVNYLATVPGPSPETRVVAGKSSVEDSGFVVVGVCNFDSETFSFPPDTASVPYVTITDAQQGLIRFSILQS